jgi:hypothetical protein
VYLYAVVRSPRRPSLARAPSGLPQAGTLRVLDAGAGLWLVAADVPLARYGEEAIERGLKDLDWVAARALAHEEVVRHFARRLTTVPMRLFTLFRGDDRAREHVQKSKAQLARVLSRVEGCEEWGVRAFADEKAERPKAAVLRGPDVGRRFLEQKRAQHRAASSSSTAAARAAQAFVRTLGHSARAQRKLPIPSAATSSRLLVDAAFLVPRDERQSFRRAVAKAAAEGRRQGVRITSTGPWPPYNFVDATR